MRLTGYNGHAELRLGKGLDFKSGDTKIMRKTASVTVTGDTDFERFTEEGFTCVLDDVSGKGVRMNSTLE